MVVTKNTTNTDKWEEEKYLKQIKARSYLTENSSIDEIFEWISESNFDSEELKQFIQDNISFFASENFRKKLIEKWTKLKNKNDMIMIVFLITFIDSINENNEINNIIKKELDLTRDKITEIIESNEEKVSSYNAQKEIITKKAKQLEETIYTLENEISQYRELIKRQSDNLKEKITLIEELNKKELLLVKTFKQSHELVKRSKRIGIFLEIANTRWKLKINPIVIDAIKKQKIHSNNEKDYSDTYTKEYTSSIVRYKDYPDIREFHLKNIWEDSGKQTTKNSNETEFNSEDIKKMMDRIYELEEQAKIDSKKIEELKKTSQKQAKKIKELKVEKKKLKDDNEKLQKIIIISGWNRFQSTKKED